MRKDVAEANKLEDASPTSANGSPAAAQVKLAASAEFVNSAAALPAFQTTYGFTLKPDQLIMLSGGDTAATIAAAANQTNGVNAAMVYGTDGGIAPSGLVVLDDDKGVQPVYAAGADHPRSGAEGAIREIEDAAGAGLRQARPRRRCRSSTAASRSAAKPAKAVAEDWLKEKGFLK